ncbi:MAG: tryptophan-rich sensory protein, partial [Ruminococcus sp.]|nr:tryptophan-rich sensory protein [Ruminococcus sp.]
MKKIKWTELIISIVGTELVGALSALISGGYSEYYSQLVQPAFAPPSAVFPVVWAVLYAVMGFSAYLVYFSESPQRKNALIIYITQLFINFSWS